jgi:hypothetical protein
MPKAAAHEPTLSVCATVERLSALTITSNYPKSKIVRVKQDGQDREPGVGGRHENFSRWHR